MTCARPRSAIERTIEARKASVAGLCGYLRRRRSRDVPLVVRFATGRGPLERVARVNARYRASKSVMPSVRSW